MNAETLKKKESALGTILDMMDVPAMRKEINSPNVRWLMRNLGARNSGHPMFDTARILLKEIFKEIRKSA